MMEKDKYLLRQSLIGIFCQITLAFRYGIGSGRLLVKMYLTGLLHGLGVKHSPKLPT